MFGWLPIITLSSLAFRWLKKMLLMIVNNDESWPIYFGKLLDFSVSMFGPIQLLHKEQIQSLLFLYLQKEALWINTCNFSILKHHLLLYYISFEKVNPFPTPYFTTRHICNIFFSEYQGRPNHFGILKWLRLFLFLL